MTNLELIKQHLNFIKQQLSLDIIIHANSSVLTASELTELPEFHRWHINKYCLKIKSNRSLHKRCVNLSGRFMHKVLKSPEVIKSTCFAGVTEYAKAVFWGEKLLCTISATGYKGRLPHSIADLLGRRVGLSTNDLLTLREEHLPDADESSVIYAIEILEQLIVRYYISNGRTDKKASDIGKPNKYVEWALEYINTCYCEDISADKIAAHCYLSTAYLQKLFSESLGHGIAEELRLCRISHAKELLCSTDFSVKHIAFACGFKSSDYFSTLFKKEIGISPLKYRKESRQ